MSQNQVRWAASTVPTLVLYDLYQTKDKFRALGHQRSLPATDLSSLQELHVGSHLLGFPPQHHPQSTAAKNSRRGNGCSPPCASFPRYCYFPRPTPPPLYTPPQALPHMSGLQEGWPCLILWGFSRNFSTISTAYFHQCPLASYEYGAILVSQISIKSCQTRDGHSLSEWNFSSSSDYWCMCVKGSNTVNTESNHIWGRQFTP